MFMWQRLISSFSSDDIFGIDSLRELLSKDLHGVAWRDFVDMNWTDPQNIDVIFFSLTKEAKAALNEIYFYKVKQDANLN